MNWYDVLPERVAMMQISYERQQRALRAREAGLRYKQIARLFGVCPARAQQMVQRALVNRTPPINEFCGTAARTAASIAVFKSPRRW